MKFYTPKGSQLQDPRSVVTVHDSQPFRTTSLPCIAQPVDDGGTRKYGLVIIGTGADAGRFPAIKGATISSSHMQLSCIPDKLIICVRKIQSALTCSDPDSYLVIKVLRINFNNQAGILSTYTPEQL